jgi:hypothetical protein
VRRALALVLVMLACDDGPPSPGPTPPTRIAPRADASVPAGPRAYPIVASFVAADIAFGLDGTTERATLWESQPASDDQPDPRARTATLEGPALKALWGQLSALPWRGARAEDRWGHAMLTVVSDDVGGRLVEEDVLPDAGGLTEPVTAARRAFEAAGADAGLTALADVKTELVVPPHVDASRGEPIAGSCDAHGDVVCLQSGHIKTMCFPTPQRDVFSCFERPWGDEGHLVRNNGHRGIDFPLHFTSAWGMELPKGMRCSSKLDPDSDFTCDDGHELTGVRPGAQRWLAHRRVVPRGDRGPVALGAPVTLARVFPRSGQLPLGTAPGAVGTFELELGQGNGLAMWTRRLTLTGDAKGATGWVFSGSRRAPHEVTLRRGTLSAPQVAALWKELEALAWPKLTTETSMIADATGSTLTIAAGGVVLRVSSDGGCRCRSPRPDVEIDSCKCPTAEAVAAVERVANELPPVKWTTRVVTLKAPAQQAVKGHCFADDTCLVEGNTKSRRCMVTKPGLAWCPASVWDPVGVSIKTPPEWSPRQDDAWGIELDDGEKCQGHRGRYDCAAGTLVLQLYGDDGGPTALAVVRRTGASEDTPVPVKTVWRAPAPARR